MAGRKSKTRNTERPPEKASAEWRHAQRVFEAVQRSLRRRKGVAGVDIGPERTSGAPTGRLAIRIHVEDKPRLKSIPVRQQFPDEIQGVPVDVVKNVFRSSVCSIKGAKFRVRKDTLFGGLAIGPSGSSEMGTLAMVVTTANGDDHLLTCAHVVDDQIGLEIVQPHGGGVSDVVGSVADTHWNGEMDAAVVRLTDDRVAGAGVYYLGAIDAVPLSVPDHWHNVPVVFVGACSGKRRGTLTSASFSGKVESPAGSTTVRDHLVIETLDSDPLGRQGDSGALVVCDGRAIGMVTAVSDDDAGTVLAARIVPILERFGMSIAT